MSVNAEALTGDDERQQRPVLVFVTSRRSGPARRMSSLVAWFHVTRKRHLEVRTVDVEHDSDLVGRLGVHEVPSLALVVDRRVVGTLEGRATGRQIEALIAPYVPAPVKRAT